jgi:endo-1,4-beta-xylanase
VLTATLEKFKGLGLQVQVTELDISVYPKEHSRRERKPGDADAFYTAEREAKQVDVYNMLFRVFRNYKDVLTNVTFWNISDRSSWLDNFPVPGRKDYPLLFDKDLKPKKAFWEVVKFGRN